MKIINKLNEKLDYNKEIFILAYIVGLILFLSSGFLFRTYLFGAVLFILIGAYALGIATSYYIYEKAEYVTYGIKIRDKIRRMFRR